MEKKHRDKITEMELEARQLQQKIIAQIRAIPGYGKALERGNVVLKN